MTSRAEFRLVLRQDNADLRLTEKGYELGLATKDRVERMRTKRRSTEEELVRLRETRISADKIEAVLDAGSVQGTSATLAELLARPEVSYSDLEKISQARTDLPPEVIEQAVIEIKYAGYIEKQTRQIAKFAKSESRKIPSDLDYESLDGLRTEAVHKLSQIRPSSIGQAARISGVSPADISVLMIHLTKMEASR